MAVSFPETDYHQFTYQCMCDKVLAIVAQENSDYKRPRGKTIRREFQEIRANSMHKEEDFCITGIMTHGTTRHCRKPP